MWWIKLFLSSELTQLPQLVHGERLEQVDSFVYFGSKVMRTVQIRWSWRGLSSDSPQVGQVDEDSGKISRSPPPLLQCNWWKPRSVPLWHKDVKHGHWRRGAYRLLGTKTSENCWYGQSCWELNKFTRWLERKVNCQVTSNPKGCDISGIWWHNTTTLKPAWWPLLWKEWETAEDHRFPGLTTP